MSSRTIHVPRATPAGSTLPPDTEFVAEAVRLKRALRAGPDAAKQHLLSYLLIVAHDEGTTPGGVLDKLVRSQPSRNDQQLLLRRFRAALDA